jgi:hypothetical protein
MLRSLSYCIVFWIGPRSVFGSRPSPTTLSRERDERVDELAVDRLGDVEPLDGDAPLAGVAEGGPEQGLDQLLPVGAGQHDRRVVAAELEGDPLERARRAGHHLLAGSDRAREADLGDVGCSVITAPISLPPETTLSTPAGKIRRAISPNRRVHSGVYGDGLMTMVCCR